MTLVFLLCRVARYRCYHLRCRESEVRLCFRLQPTTARHLPRQRCTSATHSSMLKSTAPRSRRRLPSASRCGFHPLQFILAGDRCGTGALCVSACANLKGSVYTSAQPWSSRSGVKVLCRFKLEWEEEGPINLKTKREFGTSLGHLQSYRQLSQMPKQNRLPWFWGQNIDSFLFRK